MKSQKGQGMVAFVVIIVNVGLIIVAIGMALTQSPEGQDMQSNALQALSSNGEELNSHPLEKHGVKTVEEVQSCLDNGGIVKELKNDETGRVAKVCFIDSCQKFGAKIEECNGDLVTLFKKEKLKTLDQVLKYFLNRGYKEH